MAEDFSLRRIERIFIFFCHWVSINTPLVRLIALKMIQQNQSHLMISFYNHNNLYYFLYLLYQSRYRSGQIFFITQNQAKISILVSLGSYRYRVVTFDRVKGESCNQVNKAKLCLPD